MEKDYFKKMFNYQRHEKILQKLNLQGSLNTEQMAEECQVSAETIRKDLILLDQQGKLRRVRSGAVRAPMSRYDLPLPEREAFHRPEKGAIASAACKLIRNRDTVFLDASSTVMTMTEFFPDLEATVITNAHHVVVSLGDRDKVDLICTGGDYEKRSRSYVGTLAEEAARRFYMQWLFMGVDGLDAERGASEVNRGQARLKEQILNMAEHVCILADHSKLNRKSPFFFARPHQIHTLITDGKATPEQLAPFRDQNIRVITA